MKEQVLTPIDDCLLNQRYLIETVFNKFRNLYETEYSRHRSVTGFAANMLSGLIAYYWFPLKSTLKNVSAYPQVIKS